ncbi:MAG TPA: ankyrin repeat domain-containing protein [Candidatus Babeliales bacterium]|nr:ankyrin repeat domain-containing protein [Candidatus Babeliales bacterium]
MFIAKIKRFLGLGLLLALSLGISTNYLWAAEAAGGSGGGGSGAGGGAGDVNRYAALSQAEKDAKLIDAAAEDGSLEKARLLLGAGADVNAQNQFGYSALMTAAVRGDVEVVQLLLAAGANVNMQNRDGYSALMTAARNKHVEVVRLLLAAGANVNVQDHDGYSALTWAVIRGHVAVVQLLLGAGADVPAGPAADRLSAKQNAIIQTALAELAVRKAELLAAAATGNLAKINELIDLPIRGDRKLVMNQALIALASSETDIPAADFERILAILLAHGADIDYAELVTVGVGESKGGGAAAAPQELMGALDLAIQQNHATRVQLLIARGADPLRLSNATRERLAPFTLRTSRAGASAYVAELAENWENRLLDMQDVVMSDAAKERYLDQAFAIAEIIKEKVVELSKEGREQRLMAREDWR